MPSYRVVVVAKVREYYIVEADDEDAASTMATEAFMEPILSEPIPESGEVEEIEEIE